MPIDIDPLAQQGQGPGEHDPSSPDAERRRSSYYGFKRNIRIREVDFSSSTNVPPVLNSSSSRSAAEPVAPSASPGAPEAAAIISISTGENDASNPIIEIDRAREGEDEESRANDAFRVVERETNRGESHRAAGGPREDDPVRATTTTVVDGDKDATTANVPPRREQPVVKKGYKKRLRLWYRERMRPFWKIILAQIACAAYILVATFAHPPLGIADAATKDIIDPDSAENTEDGVIYVNGSLRPVVAIGDWQKICLAVSRISAFSMYPMLVIVFITKMRGTQSFFSKTQYSMDFAMITEGHNYHVYAGRYIAFDVWLHTAFHLLRWLSQENIRLLWTTATGITGLVTMVVTPLVAFPMMYWKGSIRYEVRKRLHYLFYVFAVAMCFHVPPSGVPNGGFLPFVLGGSVVLYALDAFYVSLFMTEKIETTEFHVLSTGVRISMPVSERFRRKLERGGFAYVCIPWIGGEHGGREWHPFSLFEDPSDGSVQQMFMMKGGDWTTAVHSALSRNTTRPVWIKGPFPSPFGHASSYDNQILVASGIGITPALGVINVFKSSRRVNLIWAVRDPEMLEFFLEKMYLEHDGWNLIFYTGKKPLSPEICNLNTNVRVIKGRPKLGSVIPNIIYGIESKEGLPEIHTERSKDEMKLLLARRVAELEQESGMRQSTKVARILEYGEVLGFSLTEMIGSAGGEHDMKKLMMSSTKSNAPAAEVDAETFLNGLKSSIARSLVASETDHSRRPSSRSGRRRSDVVWSSILEGLGRGDLRPAFCPWEESASQERCVRRFNDNIMTTWGIMYCGGSGPVISALKEVSIDYDVDLHIDSFAW